MNSKARNDTETESNWICLDFLGFPRPKSRLINGLRAEKTRKNSNSFRIRAAGCADELRTTEPSPLSRRSSEPLRNVAIHAKFAPAMFGFLLQAIVVPDLRRILLAVGLVQRTSAGVVDPIARQTGFHPAGMPRLRHQAQLARASTASSRRADLLGCCAA